MKHLVFIITVFVFNSCATTIMTDDKYSNIKPKISSKYKKNKSVITPFLRLDHKYSSKNKGVKVSKNKIFHDVVSKAFSSENGFEKVEIHDFALDSYEIKGETENETPKLEKFLQKETFKYKGQYYIDVYSYSLFVGHHHSYRVLWGIIHIFSLGVIPIWWTEDIEMRIRIYDKDRKFIKEKKIKNSVSKIAWSPFIFRKDARKSYDEEFDRIVLTNSLNGLLDNLD